MIEQEALALSVVIEAPVAFMVARAMLWRGRGYFHIAAASAVATAVTHPQLWAGALWAYDYAPWLAVMLVLESLVVLVEGALIAWMADLPLRHAMPISFLANSASLLAGLLIGS